MKRALPIIFAVSLFGAEPSQDMIKAVKSGDIKSISSLIKTKEDANSALSNGKSILMLSIWEQKDNIVKMLIDKGADINAKDESGKTPLMLAVWKENLAIVKLLIKNGADKTAKNKENLTAADIAELTGNGEIIDYFKSNP